MPCKLTDAFDKIITFSLEMADLPGLTSSDNHFVDGALECPQGMFDASLGFTLASGPGDVVKQ